MATFSVSQEGPVNALALNRDNNQVAIGGRNVFKVYSIEDDCFKEICNLRASKHLNLSFSCNDVAWSLIDDHYLATAATNGHVCVWNLTKSGKAMQEQDYQEHKRTVNKVNFHASEPNRLISGSQDGTMRYFDIRTKSAVAIFYSNTESVRDVQFSPHAPATFAAVSENGNVQIWDVRRHDKYQQQFTAHSGPVFACDWHPDTSWLATASRDKTIKVWDLGSSKTTLEYTIHTIASIGHIKWRPQRKYHIASCALVIDCSVNIWDVRRPYIPFAAFNEHKDIPSGVVWRGDPQIFLSTGRDCTLYQHAFRDATRPANKANPQGISLNNHGEIIFAYRIPINNTFSKQPGLIRKSSNTISNDQFHQASSAIHQFNIVTCQDQHSFYDLAKNYILTGRSFSEICEHNSSIAKEYGKNNVSIVWRIIKIMYGDEFYPSPANTPLTNNNDKCFLKIVGYPNDYVSEDQRSKGGDVSGSKYIGDETEVDRDLVDYVGGFNGFSVYNNFRFGLPKGDFSFGENELDNELDALSLDYRNSLQNSQQLGQQQQDWTLPNEAFNLRHEISDRSPPPENLQNHYSPDINDECLQPVQYDDQVPGLLTVSKTVEKCLWDPSNTVVDALKYHATMGDIQTAACVLIVLGDRRKHLKTLDDVTQEQWLLGYLDMLHRYQLWNVATQVIKISWLPSVNCLNQQSTRINTNCSQCAKPLQRTGWLCDRCHTSEHSLCSVCHQVVKGLYAWCQGCSHGGHLKHMQEWIAAKKVCPTGCGHQCEYR
ncbi:GATOR2 complex protein WDR24 isoform X2 [Onthophagus taurus]|uniref:GATOR2 complex protein WDR24 isoform X2 n=1 Tax=Onthophagus taurus TaxID=166361 RepID=UPI000C2032AD|nr:GATOR complex protein WDR24 isoform X2 [Onthophagus taurus]